MLWLEFILSALAVVAGGVLAVRCGDSIAIHTQLGRFLFGTLLLAAGTSLTELITGIDAVRFGLPEIAAGDMLGATMTNMLFLGLLDLLVRQARLLHSIAITHSLTAGLAVLLISLATLFILLPFSLLVGPVDMGSIILLLVFVGGTRLIQQRARTVPAAATEEPTPALPLKWAIVGFLAAVVILVVATPVLVRSAEGIAVATGLGVGLIGAALVPLVTSMPELVSSVTAVRIGAFDLAIGNLFGSSVFNIVALALVSLFVSPGSLFADISPSFAIVGLLSLVLISIALLGTLAPAEWRVLGIEWDAVMIILVYLAGIYILYRQRMLLAF